MATPARPDSESGRLVAAPWKKLDYPLAEVPADERNDFVRPLVRLDLVTPLERAFEGLVFVAFVSMLALGLSGFPWGGFAAFFVLFVALLGHFSADCTYVLDNRAARLDYVRSVFGFEGRSTVCNFEDIVAVAVDSRPAFMRSLASYALVLVLSDGKILAVAEPRSGEMGLLSMNLRGRLLAEHLGVAFIEGKPFSRLRVARSPEGKVTFRTLPVSESDL